MKKVSNKEVIVYHVCMYVLHVCMYYMYVCTLYIVYHTLIHFQENGKTTVLPVLLSRFKAWFQNKSFRSIH